MHADGGILIHPVIKGRRHVIYYDAVFHIRDDNSVIADRIEDSLQRFYPGFIK